MTGRVAGARWPVEFEQMIRQQCRFVDAATPIDPDTALAALGIDSVQMLSMIVEIEETFLVEIPDTMLTGEHFATAGSIWAAVRSLLAAAGRGEHG